MTDKPEAFYCDIHKYQISNAQLATIIMAQIKGIKLDDEEVEYVIRTQHIDEKTGEVADRVVLMPPLGGKAGQVGLHYCDNSYDYQWIERITGLRIKDLPISPTQEVTRNPVKKLGKYEVKVKKGRFLIVVAPGGFRGLKKKKRNILFFATKKGAGDEHIARVMEEQEPEQEAVQQPSQPAQDGPIYSQWMIDEVVKRKVVAADKAGAFIKLLLEYAQINSGFLDAIDHIARVDILAAGINQYEKSFNSSGKKVIALQEAGVKIQEVIEHWNQNQDPTAPTF